jgi:large subunit ribosomal protein L6
MSRLAKKPIVIPAGLQVAKEGGRLAVKGKQGTLFVDLLPGIDAEFREAGSVHIVRRDEEKKTRSYQGLIFRLLTNAINGLTTGYKRSWRSWERVTRPN